jgi:uncharacterized protein
MKIISNTGPIIGLAKIGRLNLLKTLFGEVFIPPLVHKELYGRIGTESEELEQALHDFIQVLESRYSGSKIRDLIAHLDEGEKQVISAAFEVRSEVLLLLDDRAGRQVARGLNIPLTGVVGILLLAKQRGLVADVVEIVEELRSRGYWLSNEVVDAAKRLAGE